MHCTRLYLGIFEYNAPFKYSPISMMLVCRMKRTRPYTCFIWFKTSGHKYLNHIHILISLEPNALTQSKWLFFLIAQAKNTISCVAGPSKQMSEREKNTAINVWVIFYDCILDDIIVILANE